MAANTIEFLDPRVNVIQVVAQGPQGKAGTIPGGSIDVNFSYGDPSPLALVTVGAQKLIQQVSISIRTAFNGIGASLSEANGVFASTDLDPSTIGTYSIFPDISFNTPTTLELLITPGVGATQGFGTISITYQT